MIRVKALLFAAAAAILLNCGLEEGASAENIQNGPVNGVVVYYFHGNFRCVNCKTIEQNTKEALEKYFRKELDAGTVVFKAVNVETKGNEHFTEDYKLYTKSVVLSLVKGGKEVKSGNLTRVWEYLRNKDAFHQYIKGEVEKYLEEL
ncbi:MAG: nitrophenyl compound nitroreductase subunit ArsF family protein [Candidatus Omnitrophota bacterium]